MSENVDLVRSIYADWGRGDWSSTAWMDAEITVVSVDEPGGREATGAVAVAAAFREFLSVWDGYRVEAREYRELEDGRVLVLLQAFGRSRTAGLDLKDVTGRQSAANVFEIRNGKVNRIDSYFDEGRALADLGLEE